METLSRSPHSTYLFLRLSLRGFSASSFNLFSLKMWVSLKYCGSCCAFVHYGIKDLAPICRLLCKGHRYSRVCLLITFDYLKGHLKVPVCVGVEVFKSELWWIASVRSPKVKWAKSDKRRWQWWTDSHWNVLPVLVDFSLSMTSLASVTLSKSLALDACKGVARLKITLEYL